MLSRDGNPIMAFLRPSFSPSIERAPHYTNTRIPYGRWSFALALSLALPNPLFPLLVTHQHLSQAAGLRSHEGAVCIKSSHEGVVCIKRGDTH